MDPVLHFCLSLCWRFSLFFLLTSMLFVNFINRSMFWSWRFVLGWQSLHHCWRVCLLFLVEIFLCSLHLLPSATGLNVCMTLTLNFTKSCQRCFDILCWPTMVWEIPRSCAVQDLELQPPTLILWNSTGIQILTCTESPSDYAVPALWK